MKLPHGALLGVLILISLSCESLNPVRSDVTVARVASLDFNLLNYPLDSKETPVDLLIPSSLYYVKITHTTEGDIYTPYLSSDHVYIHSPSGFCHFTEKIIFQTSDDLLSMMGTGKKYELEARLIRPPSVYKDSKAIPFQRREYDIDWASHNRLSFDGHPEGGFGRRLELDVAYYLVDEKVSGCPNPMVLLYERISRKYYLMKRQDIFITANGTLINYYLDGAMRLYGGGDGGQIVIRFIRNSPVIDHFKCEAKGAVVEKYKQTESVQSGRDGTIERIAVADFDSLFTGEQHPHLVKKPCRSPLAVYP